MDIMDGTRGNGLSQLKNGVDYINPGEDEQMEIYGYQENKMRNRITWLLIILSGGILRLIFHWFPQLMIACTHSRCTLDKADTVLLIERFQGKHPSHYVEKIKLVTSKDLINDSANNEQLNDEPLSDSKNPDIPNKVTVTKDNETDIMLSIRLYGENFKKVSSVLLFECKKVKYAWDTERCEFMKLIGLDSDVSLSTLHQMPGLSKHELFRRLCVYGKNEIAIQVESSWRLLGREILTPFYVFQILSFILWISDAYWKYAAAIGIMSGSGIIMAVWQTRKNQHGLRSKLHSSDVATVIRDRRTAATSTITAEYLVPGDILVIPPHGCVMSCDAVLLTGNCILNESMLTGESVPVTKTPIPISNTANFNIKEHARHTLFCGTKVIQTRYYGGEKVLAVVVRTGYSTSKGELVRSILYPAPVDFKFEKDSYKFVAILAGIACLAAVYTVIIKLRMGLEDTPKIIRRTLDLFTILVPPALPAAMTVGRLIAQRRLEKKRIFCTSPPAINISGCIDCICFDKTGTLTEDGLDMWGIVDANNRKFTTPINDISSLPINDTLIGMATCHGITIIDGQLAGDPLDLKMFESTGWTLEEPDVSDQSKFCILQPTVVKPPPNKIIQTPNHDISSIIRQNSLTSDTTDDVSLNNLTTYDDEMAEQGLQVAIFKQFQFSSSLQRMSVITRILGAPNFVLYCKGSPEMILSLSKPESIPSDFSSILQEYTSEGYRVIALARKTLNRLPFTKFDRITRESVEIDLTFLGFVILENRLKPETTPVIEELNRACMKIVMITGDNMLTALSVARDCDLIKPEMSVITVATVNPQNHTKPQLYFTKSSSQSSPLSPNGNGSISEMTDLNSIASLETIESGSFTHNGVANGGINYLTDRINTSNKYVFSMTGTTWTIVKQHYPELISKLVTRGAIFARMSPDHKKQLVMELQSMGYYVAMVGDGANDCGALKAAHIGISLSDTESSIASPFTSRETNISCVLSVVREGRAALVTSFSTFKYMAGYSLVQFMSVMTLYEIGSNLTDTEYLYIDLFIISIFAYFSGNTHAYNGPLAKRTPPTSLISISTILSIFLQILTMFVFQFVALFHVRRTDGFKPYDINKIEDEDPSCMENYAVFIMSSMQYIALGVVFSKGHPYRKTIFTNYGLLASFIVLSLFSINLAVFPHSYIKEMFGLILPEDPSFKVIILLYGVANFFVSLFVESFVIDYLVIKKLQHKWHNIDKSKKKFLAVERDMGKNLKWPPLSQEPLPEATPDILIRQTIVNEIKIEKILPEPVVHQLEPAFLNNGSAVSADFKRFGSAREVTLNPRSLFTNKRDSVSMQTVPLGLEDRELNRLRQPKLELSLKRRHNSDSENGFVSASPNRIKQINPIATLPRNHQVGQQKLSESRASKNEEEKIATQSFLELDILPS